MLRLMQLCVVLWTAVLCAAIGMSSGPLKIDLPCGLIWLQGWNDSIDGTRRDKYENNSVDLVTDLRRELGRANVPAVIVESADASDPLRMARENAVRRLNTLAPHSATYVPEAGLNADLRGGFHFQARTEDDLGVDWRTGQDVLEKSLAGSELVASTAGSRLREDDQGLAAQYPGDSGIAEDPRVLFVENFAASSIKEIAGHWESVQDSNTMSLSNDVPSGSSDGQSLLITHVGGQGTGGQLYRRLPAGHSRVFARFYVKFAHDCAPIHHFGTHLGGFHPSTPWPQGGAGELPDGNKRFTTGVEPYGRDWQWDFYSYWQGMRVHGDGNYWGTPFLQGVARPKVVKDQWICVEMMVQLNDPVTGANGEQAFWINGRLWRVDGQIVSHIGPGYPRGRWTGGWWHPDAASETRFEGFNWRAIEQLTVNYVWTYLYITKAPIGHVSHVGFDNIVVATDYIGPITPQKP